MNKKIDDIDFDDIDISKYQKEIDKIDKIIKGLSKSKSIQKALKMLDLRKSLGFDDNRKLKDIKVLNNSLEFIFKDKSSTIISIEELVKLYNYFK